MTGAVDGTLAKKYADWEGSSSVHFNPTHWMNIPFAKKYLEWVSNCFPEEKIGLIWDSASAHINTDVLEFASELGITVGIIAGRNDFYSTSL